MHQHTYYDRIASVYDAARPLPRWVSEQVADRIVERVGASPETTFLELGIGTGRTGLSLIQRGYPYTGIDISQAMLEELRRKLGGVPSNLTLIRADAATLPFGDRQFDIVLSTHVLHCLPNLPQALAEIRRVLKSKGLYLECENLMPQHQLEFEFPLRQILAKQPPTPPSEKPIPCYPITEEIRHILQTQGATIEQLTVAQWQVEQTVEELLQIYQSRAVGLCWQVPDAEFFAAMERFAHWCHQYYDTTSGGLFSEVSFDIMVADHRIDRGFYP